VSGILGVENRKPNLFFLFSSRQLLPKKKKTNKKKFYFILFNFFCERPPPLGRSLSAGERGGGRGGEGRGGNECVRADAGVRPRRCNLASARTHTSYRTDSPQLPLGRIFSSADCKSRPPVKSCPRDKRGRACRVGVWTKRMSGR
jgi:hypothetical protein